MNGQQQWTRVAVMALLVLTAMAAEGGKAEKQGEACKAQDGFFKNKRNNKNESAGLDCLYAVY